MNDRALRGVVIGLGGRANGYVRETGFDITAASEVMAIAAVARDLFDLRKRLGAITVAYTWEGEPVTAEQLKAAGAMTVLLKDAIKPNLVQTLEGQPAFVHCGPFANIAHGNSSLVADLVGLKLGDYVVTESGFGSDMGMEKFLDIVCRVGIDRAERDRARRDRARARSTTAASRTAASTRSRRRRATSPATSGSSGVRPERRRRGQPLPGRHRRGDRDRAPARARARRALGRGQLGVRGRRRRARPSSPRRSSTRRSRRARSSPSTRSTHRSRRRSRRSPGASTAPTGSTCCPPPRTTSSASPRRGSTRCRSAWRRRISRSRTTRTWPGAPTGFTVPVRAVRAYTGAGLARRPLRRHADDARALGDAGRVQRRHRREWPHRRALLSPSPRGRRSRARSSSPPASRS